MHVYDFYVYGVLPNVKFHVVLNLVRRNDEFAGRARSVRASAGPHPLRFRHRQHSALEPLTDFFSESASDVRHAPLGPSKTRAGFGRPGAQTSGRPAPTPGAVRRVTVRGAE